ncbi:MAG: DUF1285 domain-containing protein [Bdellovibrio sp.]|nr:DUF1285 domain-containing protein [Bdellovibrio sp.]
MSEEKNAPFFVDREVIILTRNGIWLADGTEITHEPTRRLFARSLKKNEDGYYLHVGRETKKIQVEDTAYFVTRIDGSLRDGFTLSINDGSSEALLAETLTYRPGRLVCKIKQKTEEAKFLHAPYFDLLRNLQEDQTSYYLEFQKKGARERITLSKK